VENLLLPAGSLRHSDKSVTLVLMSFVLSDKDCSGQAVGSHWRRRAVVVAVVLTELLPVCSKLSEQRPYQVFLVGNPHLVCAWTIGR